MMARQAVASRLVPFFSPCRYLVALGSLFSSSSLERVFRSSKSLSSVTLNKMAKRQLRKRRTSKEKKVLVVNKNKKNKSKAGSKSATSAADTPQGDSPRRLELAAAHQELISDEAEQAKEVEVVKEKEEGVNSHQTPKKTTGSAADNGGFHLLRRSGKETVVVFARLSPPPPPPSPSVNSSPPPPPPPTSPATSSFYSPTSSPSPSFNSPLLLPTSPSPSPSPATSSFFSTSTPLPPSPSSKTAKPTEVVAQEEVDWEIVAIFDVSSKTAATGKSTAPRKKYLVGWKNSNSNSSSAVDYTASWVSESQLESGCKALLDLFNAHQQAFEEWKRNLFQLGFHCFQCALHRCHELVLKKLKEAGESLLAEQLKSLFSEPDWLSEKTKPAEKSKKAKPKPKMKMKMKKEMMKKEKEKEKEEKEEAKSQLLLKMKLLFAATKLADTLVAVGNVKMKSEDPGDTTSDLVEGSDELYGVEDYRRLIGWQLKELQKLQ